MDARDRIINALKGAGLSLPDIHDAVEAIERIAAYHDDGSLVIYPAEDGDFE